MKRPLQIPNFLAVDFYCGAGGTTRGLIDAGGYVIAGVDKDISCRRTYRENNWNETLDRASPRFIQKDMFPALPDYPEGKQDEILNDLHGLIMFRRALVEAAAGRKIPLLFAICAPCQSFTKFVQHSLTDARAAGRERDRNLLAQALVFVKRFQPDMVLSENVAAIENGAHSQLWKDFKTELRCQGYRVGSGVVDASRYDVPQHRRRSIIVAVKASYPDRVSLDIPIPAGSDSELPKVRDAIGNLPPLKAGGKDESVPNHQCRNLSEINRRRLLAVNPGEPNSGFPNELVLPCHRRLEKGGQRGFGDVYTRLRPDRPSPTITTRFHSVSNGRFGHYDSKQKRGLSLREGALLQSFPRGYKFHADGMDAIARMIGNAVPPNLAKHMAKHLCEIWIQERDLAGTPFQVNS